MIIGNVRNSNDLNAQKKRAAEYLALMVENEGVKEKRLADFKNPYKPAQMPPQYKTVDELGKDTQAQERLLMTNLKDLGVADKESREFILIVEQRPDGVQNLVKLNRNFPAFRKYVSDTVLASQLTAGVLLNVYDNFARDIEQITGLRSVDISGSNQYFGADGAGEDAIEELPTDDLMTNIKTLYRRLFELTGGGAGNNGGAGGSGVVIIYWQN